MLWRRMLYLMSLIGCFGFYVAYREWMAGMILLTVLLLPWFSLLISLPAMLSTKLEAEPSAIVVLGERKELHLKMRSFLPAPPLGWRFRASSSFENKTILLDRENIFSAEHCGCWRVRVKRGRKYDYLGLLRLPFGRKLEQKVYVFPKKQEVFNLPSLNRYLVGTWKPKPETFSENYDLRLYRPGDSLKQIHWKLSSKTGKFILREPIVAERGTLAVSFVLSGTPEELDRKLGRVLYLSELFLSKKLPFEVHCKTANGVRIFRISSELEQNNAICTILEQPLSVNDEMSSVRAAWHYHIGGEADEV